MNKPNQFLKQFIWRCPSNIAIVKYWGKTDNQIPCNPSISMTLSKSYSEIKLDLLTKTSDSPVELDYLFEGEKVLLFEKRIIHYLKNQIDYFPFLKDYAIRINSKNNFPHSAGIASSASSFGAITLALLEATQKFVNPIQQKSFLNQASYLARLGSGSACRSIFPGFTCWGTTAAVSGSNNEYAITLPEIHPNFKRLQDAILVVESRPKKVSSSVGHSLMKNHPYAESRFKQANQHIEALNEILTSGDMQRFIQITESEALTLHAMMLTSNDYYILMQPKTLIAIEKIINFRKATHIPICFTLDAGPNLHVFYRDEDKEKVNTFLNNDFKNCVQQIIFDELGSGPEKLKNYN